MPHVDPATNDWVPIDPELLKRIYDRLLAESGAEVLFNTMLSAVETDGQGGAGEIIVANKAGLSALRARVYVDATGDGDLAAWAGAEFQMADDLQPSTLCFVLSNVDDYAYRTGPNLHGANPASPLHQILRSGRYPLIGDLHMCTGVIGPGTVGFNAGHLWDVDNTDPWSVSRALPRGRKIAAQIRDALAEFHPKAFAGAFLVATAPLMGVRESRRIIGDYVLTIDDYVARRGFPDEICRNSYFIDVHLTAAEAAMGSKGAAAFEERSRRYGPGESHGIPYRCLTPKSLKNVLVAGRSVSCDHLVQGSIRVMPVCLAMGEAAGLGAAQAAALKDADAHRVDTVRLRARLKEHGAYLPDV
jgi:hypothetical protein